MGNFISTHFIWSHGVIENLKENQELIDFLWNKVNLFFDDNSQLLNQIIFQTPIIYMSSITEKEYKTLQDSKLLSFEKKTHIVSTRDFIGVNPSLRSVPAGPANEVTIYSFKAFLLQFSLFPKINKNIEIMSLLNSNKPILNYLLEKPNFNFIKAETKAQFEMLEIGLSGHLSSILNNNFKTEVQIQLLQKFFDFDVYLYNEHSKEGSKNKFDMNSLEEQFENAMDILNEEGKPLLRSCEWTTSIINEDGTRCPSTRERLNELGYLYLTLTEALGMGTEEMRQRLVVCTKSGCFEAEGMPPSKNCLISKKKKRFLNIYFFK